jgi:SpoVK/Ycf46/Vps4 family AAA+-type ATPase
MSNESSATLSELLKELLDKANRVLQEQDRRTASRYLAQAAELLFLHAKKSNNVSDKQHFAERATQLLETALRLCDDNSLEQNVSSNNANSSDKASTVIGNSKRKTLTFADIAGLDNVKETLMLRVIYPLLHPEKLEHYGIEAGGGMLLYGPPGTGKTLLVRAVAGELGLPFYVIKSSEVLSQFYGQSEKQIADLFDDARKQPNGAVVFLDEIDAIGAKRTDQMNDASRRVLNQLLQELDGVDGRSGKLVFFAATNTPWLLDAALLRPPRFSERCYTPLPDAAARYALFAMTLKNSPVADDVSFDELVCDTENFSGADIVNVCERAKLFPFCESIRTNRDRLIAKEDFDQAMKTARPSIAMETLEQYERWNEK